MRWKEGLYALQQGEVVKATNLQEIYKFVHVADLAAAAVLFNCRGQGITNDSSLTDRRALFPDRRFEIPLHRETDPDIVMGARRARI